MAVAGKRDGDQAGKVTGIACLFLADLMNQRLEHLSFITSYEIELLPLIFNKSNHREHRGYTESTEKCGLILEKRD